MRQVNLVDIAEVGLLEKAGIDAADDPGLELYDSSIIPLSKLSDRPWYDEYVKKVEALPGYNPELETYLWDIW